VQYTSWWRRRRRCSYTVGLGDALLYRAPIFSGQNSPDPLDISYNIRVRMCVRVRVFLHSIVVYYAPDRSRDFNVVWISRWILRLYAAADPPLSRLHRHCRVSCLTTNTASVPITRHMTFVWPVAS